MIDNRQNQIQKHEYQQQYPLIELEAWQEFIGILEDIKTSDNVTSIYLYVPSYGQSVLMCLENSQIANQIPEIKYKGYSIGIIRTDLSPRPYFFRIIDKSPLFKHLNPGYDNNGKEKTKQERREEQSSIESMPPRTAKVHPTGVHKRRPPITRRKPRRGKTPLKKGT